MVAFVDEIYYENRIVRHLSNNMLQILTHELCGTVLRILDSGHISKPSDLISILQEVIDNIHTTKDPNILQNKVKDLFMACCTMIAEKKSSKSLIDDILDFIHHNYYRTDLGLFAIIDTFNISQTYLSKLFKTKTGFTLYEYLEKVRMEAACSLLLENDDYSVKEIAVKVGYISSNTFCRAFKRFCGISAGEYRKIVEQGT